MTKRDILNRIEELGTRLTNLSSDEKRIKKRILQQLGKLKKELLNFEGKGNENEGNVENSNEVNDELNNNSSNNEQPEEPKDLNQWTKKQCKLKLKIANSDIAELAQKKQLKAAQKKFQWCIKKGLNPDHHTYTNLLNAYVRCKDMKGAKQIWNNMIIAGIQPNIVTYTTLIKGYSENNMIASAQSLLMDMLLGKPIEGTSQQPPLPNSRTLNTYWRGCIRWGAVSPAMDIFNQINQTRNNDDPSVTLDETSYEYLITLLCQSFNLSRAIDLSLIYLELYSMVKLNTLNLTWIEENPEQEINLHDIPSTTPDNLQLLIQHTISRKMNIDTILSTASIFLHLSRTLILLQNYEVGKILLTITENFIQETKSSSLRLAMEKRRKSEPLDSDSHRVVSAANANVTSNRDNNNTSIGLFIQHQSSELSREISLLKSYLKIAMASSSSLGSSSSSSSSSSPALSIELMENTLQGYSKTLLLYDIPTTHDFCMTKEMWKEQLQTGMLTQLNESFGLKNIFNLFPTKKMKLISRVMKSIIASIRTGDSSHPTLSGYYLHFPSLFQHITQTTDTKRKIQSINDVGSNNQKKKSKKMTTQNHSSDSQSHCQSQSRDDEENDERIDSFDSTPSSPPSPGNDFLDNQLDVKMEICSGSGEWILEQAMEYQRLSSKKSGKKPILWIALEIRADRVFQSLNHAILRQATSHVALLGGDANVILPQLIADNSLTTIFINHPEPPERTSGGEDRSQGSHLLTENFFHELHRVLKLNGKLTIVTDNRLYAHSLAKTVDHINKITFSWSDEDQDKEEDHELDNRKREFHQNTSLKYDNHESDTDDSDDLENNKSITTTTTTNNNNNKTAPRPTLPTIPVRSGEPGERGDHLELDETTSSSSSSSSYFSRMWKNGSKSRVWNIVLIKK